jgi:hypothetical protein
MEDNEEFWSYAICIQNLPAFRFALDQSTKDKHCGVGL